MFGVVLFFGDGRKAARGGRRWGRMVVKRVSWQLDGIGCYRTNRSEHERNG